MANSSSIKPGRQCVPIHPDNFEKFNTEYIKFTLILYYKIYREYNSSHL